MLEVEKVRARSLAARHNNLVKEFCEEAKRIGVATAVQSERYIIAELEGGMRIAAVPAVGVPDARRYHEANLKFPSGEGLADKVVLIYDHRGMRQQWISFLSWLDDFLPVTTLRVTETAKHLTELA